ncbi:bacillithiol transferase BstA [Paenibacillus sp. N1-5-1-14]|uniref:YfiT family bacillithiol transferase n=1 Tax=Paenibacillus radicibacter TaxID=2972488 RepID=UPI0021592EE7|nr:bacillithiol transferase BstA [Paenibacillus radicibacter]MCR8641260.1 bacillithiol transferase BstA [Paenibacillus radicibacter]
MENLQYPIGTFVKPDQITEEQLAAWIQEIETLPSRLREAVEGLSNEQLDTPYRPGGWSVRQVVHHLGDSHINCVIRFKLALTEELPTIKPYEEQEWALLGDCVHTPIEVSLELLTALHEKWVILLKSMSAANFDRAFLHPVNGETKLDKATGLYAWHGNHHLAHITSLAERMGWN